MYELWYVPENGYVKRIATSVSLQIVINVLVTFFEAGFTSTEFELYRVAT